MADIWTRSDKYHNSFLIPEDKDLESALANSIAQGLPEIAVSAAQGKYLNLLIKSIGAKRVLEVGTLGGYSAIWLAKALPPDGKLVTLELEELHAKGAKENITHAGLIDKVTILQGPAAASLEKLSVTAEEPAFDFAFIDADKQSNLVYFTHAKRLVKKGGVIIVDNVVRNGDVSDPGRTGQRVEGVRNLLKALKEDKEVEATTISTVGDKGYDGFLYAFVL